MKLEVPIILLSIACMLRWLVGRFPHSGQSKPPMYGDYEAQRHWMEVTTNLPASDWYHNTTNNDLQYWGLDYPPLTAYHMQALGFVSNIYNSTWTELYKSRGEESFEHKIFMRITVLIPDLIIYMIGIIYYFYKTPPAYCPSGITREDFQKNKAVFAAFSLLYPGQILIDHGHFQYNCVFMGFVLWAVIFMTKGRFMIASFLFTLALNYKQMSLYYALPFFWHILSINIRQKPFWKGIVNILLVGILVIATTMACLAPFITSLEDMHQVVRRLFPFYRGLFEDKVANFWFSLSVFIKLRKLYTIDHLLKLSLGLTLLASLPSGVHLLFKPSIRNFKYSLFNTSLAFFLFSFQVHEKTILVPALPMMLLYREHPIAAHWFSIISAFSLHPLLIKDGQEIPFFCLLSVYLLMSTYCFKSSVSGIKKPSSISYFFVALYIVSSNTCLLFSSLNLLLEPPPRYPDAYAVLNSLYSCAHFLSFLLYFNYQQFKHATPRFIASVAPNAKSNNEALLNKKNK